MASDKTVADAEATWTTAMRQQFPNITEKEAAQMRKYAYPLFLAVLQNWIGPDPEFQTCKV